MKNKTNKKQSRWSSILCKQLLQKKEEIVRNNRKTKAMGLKKKKNLGLSVYVSNSRISMIPHKDHDRNESRKCKIFSVMNSLELNYLEQTNDNMHSFN